MLLFRIHCVVQLPLDEAENKVLLLQAVLDKVILQAVKELFRYLKGDGGKQSIAEAQWESY